MSGIPLTPLDVDPKRLNEAIRNIMQGRSNAVGQVTLRENQTTTVVTRDVAKAAANCGAGSEIFLSPRTSSAAGALGTTYISVVDQGTFTISHISAPSTDRTFGFLIAG